MAAAAINPGLIRGLVMLPAGPSLASKLDGRARRNFLAPRSRPFLFGRKRRFGQLSRPRERILCFCHQ